MEMIIGKPLCYRFFRVQSPKAWHLYTHTLRHDLVKGRRNKALAIASDIATAENNIVIEKNQVRKSGPAKDSAGRTTIGVGDQVAAYYNSPTKLFY